MQKYKLAEKIFFSIAFLSLFTCIFCTFFFDSIDSIFFNKKNRINSIFTQKRHGSIKNFFERNENKTFHANISSEYSELEITQQKKGFELVELLHNITISTTFSNNNKIDRNHILSPFGKFFFADRLLIMNNTNVDFFTNSSEYILEKKIFQARAGKVEFLFKATPFQFKAYDMICDFTYEN